MIPSLISTPSSVATYLSSLGFEHAVTTEPHLGENATSLLRGNETAGKGGLAEESDFESINFAGRMAAIFVPIFFGIIVFVGLVGNSLVITVMTKIFRVNGQRLNNTNRFILNLAISDLLFLSFCVPFHATIYTLDGWRFGGFLCVFTKFCEEMAKIASVYTLVALSVDRFLAVVYATSARQLRTRANSIRGLIFIWIAAAGLALPTVFTRVYVVYEGHKLCVLSSHFWAKWYELCLTLFGYVIPLTIIICCYTGLLRVMCKTAKNSSVTISNSSNDSRKKVTKIVIMVVVVFAINWLPHHVISLWIHFFQADFVHSARTKPLFTYVFRLIAHCLAYANSCVNPLVYAFVSRKFRQDFKKAFTCQYISEAFGSVKAFSRRVVGTMRYSTQNSTNSNTMFQGDGESSKKGQGGVSRAIYRNQKFCPRSPLTPLGSIPTKGLDTEITDDEISPFTKVSGLSSVAMTNNCELTTLMDENGCAFDEDVARDTTVL